MSCKTALCLHLCEIKLGPFGMVGPWTRSVEIAKEQFRPKPKAVPFLITRWELRRAQQQQQQKEELSRVLEAKRRREANRKRAMDFSAPSSGSSSTQFNPDQFKSQLQSQLAQAYAEEFLEVFFNHGFLSILFITIFYVLHLIFQFNTSFVRLIVFHQCLVLVHSRFVLGICRKLSWTSEF